jgi:hypothetical protein
MGVHPFVFLDTDAAQLASFAAASDNPGLFANDSFLDDPGNYQFYSTVQIPLIRLLGRLTGDYGTGFILLLGPLVFLQATGFYLFGRILFGSRYWALVLALLNIVYLDVGADLIYGIQFDPLPNFCFSAILPFLLAAAVRFRHSPRMFPWLMFAAGALVYVHPVSAPAWGFALWLGLGYMLPRDRPLKQRLARLLALGLVFLATIAPFGFWYMYHHDAGQVSPQDYGPVKEAISYRINPTNLSITRAVKSLIDNWSQKGFVGYSCWFLGAFGALFLVVRRETRQVAALICFWCAGILLPSLAIPAVDLAIARRMDRLPMQIDLFRPLLFLLPLTLILCVWPFAALWEKHRQRPYPSFSIIGGLTLTGALMVFCWNFLHQDTYQFPLPTLQTWANGQPIYCTGNAPAHVEAVQAAGRLTPPGAKFFATTYPLQIRYSALRPVVWAYKDGGPLTYSNHKKLLTWYRVLKRVGSLPTMYDEQRYRELIQVARELGAQYYFASLYGYSGDTGLLSQKLGANLIWHNENFGLFDLITNKTQSSDSNDSPTAFVGPS